jgi:NADH-ubiquinone oxidoreductase chain 2
MPKISILILLLELQTQIDIIGELSSSSFKLNLENLVNINLILGENTKYVLKNLLLLSSLLSLIIGTVVGLSQTRIKRLLAYSTISHVGFILLALVINTEQSIDSLIFYIVQYTLTNLNTFLILLALGYSINYTINKFNTLNNREYNQLGKGESNNDIKFISELKGQFYSNPVLSLGLTVCLFSMAGVPPLIGFFSKQFVLYSSIQNGYNFMSILAILTSVISASYYLKIIRLLNTEEEENSHNNNFILNSSTKSEEVKWSTIKDSVIINNKQFGESYESSKALTNFHSFLISSLTLTIILFVFKPSIILNLTQLLSLSLYNF